MAGFVLLTSFWKEDGPTVEMCQGFLAKHVIWVHLYLFTVDRIFCWTLFAFFSKKQRSGTTEVNPNLKATRTNNCFQSRS